MLLGLRFLFLLCLLLLLLAFKQQVLHYVYKSLVAFVEFVEFVVFVELTEWSLLDSLELIIRPETRCDVTLRVLLLYRFCEAAFL